MKHTNIVKSNLIFGLGKWRNQDSRNVSEHDGEDLQQILTGKTPLLLNAPEHVSLA